MQNKYSVLTATPMYGGQCSGVYMTSVMAFAMDCAQNGLRHNTSFLFNESIVQKARNILAHQFLTQTDFSHLLFVDADTAFNSKAIFPMLGADKDIICGVYSMKDINWDSVKKASDAGVPAAHLKYHSGFLTSSTKGQSVKFDQPFEVEHGGTGLMLIKREVLEAVAKKVPKFRLNAGDPEIAEIFSTWIGDDGVLRGEDYNFCRMAKQEGFKTWAAPWVNVVHYGSYGFEGSLFDPELKQVA